MPANATRSLKMAGASCAYGISRFSKTSTPLSSSYATSCRLHGRYEHTIVGCESDATRAAVVRAGPLTPEAWLREHVEPTGELGVASEHPWATVWRVPVGDEVVWLKACRPIQAFEPRLTAVLHERWPDRVPEVIAHDEGLAYLLLSDAGVQIRELGDDAPAIWGDMVRKYAELQHGEAAFADDHLAHGVHDQRLSTLPALYEDMCSRELPGDVARLRAFAPRFAELCEELASHGIPDTVQHDDLHHTNVYARDGRPGSSTGAARRSVIRSS